jgi:uncharacterized membrane protein
VLLVADGYRDVAARTRARGRSTEETAMSSSAKVSVVSNILVLVAVALAWWSPPWPLLLPYEWHKLLHLTGVIVFFGNLVVGPLWVAFAWPASERSHLAFAARTLLAADIWVTTPSVQLAVWNGLFLAGALGGARVHPWLVQSLVLVAVTSIGSVVLVLPAQERFARAADDVDLPGLRAALWRWTVGSTLVMVPRRRCST